MKLNCSEANNNIMIIDFLKSINIKPSYKKNGDYWFLSPFRNEKTPSFKVNSNKNLWCDFGSGAKGTLIDLVTSYYKCNVSKALEFLSNDIKPYNNFSFPKHNEKSIIAMEKKNNIDISYKVNHIYKAALIQYIQDRMVNLNIAKKYLKQINYKRLDKNYFGLGFINNSGGYSFNNKYIKLCIGKNDITTIESVNKDEVNVFEGFFDFLSYLTLYQNDNKYSIILNSVSNYNKALSILKDFKVINLYLDNDDAGVKTTNDIIQFINSNYKDIIIFDKSDLYKDYKDLNDMLQAAAI